MAKITITIEDTKSGELVNISWKADGKPNPYGTEAEAVAWDVLANLYSMHVDTDEVEEHGTEQLSFDFGDETGEELELSAYSADFDLPGGEGEP